MALFGSSSTTTQISPKELTTLIEDEGGFTHPKAQGREKVQAEFLDFSVQFFFFGGGESIQFHWAAAGTSATPQKINQWNQGKRFSRAYLDEEGDPHLELDLDLAGGISEGAVRRFINLSAASLMAFLTECV